MPDTPSLQPGPRFAKGRFVLTRLLGRGGMGEVWLASDERLQEPVALKFLPPEIRGDAAALDDLRRETARSHKLSHPNIVRIHDLHEEPDGMAFIVMEYVDGPTLLALRLEQPGRALSWETLRPLVEQLCAALDYAHGEKVIHRDLKPANMMVDSRGRLKLADFGIAAAASDSMSRVSVKHSTSGTLPYMSPQQLTGKHPQATDDIYALGATLYELLTSKPPFYTGDITHQVLHEAPEPMEDRLAALEIQNEIPPDVAAMVMACLAKEREQRPPSARAVAGWIGLEIERKPSTGALAETILPPAENPSVAEATRNCPYCGELLPLAAVLCSDCGHLLLQPAAMPVWKKCVIYFGSIIFTSVLFGLVGFIIGRFCFQTDQFRRRDLIPAGVGVLLGVWLGILNAQWNIQRAENEAMLSQLGQSPGRRSKSRGKLER